MALITFYNIYDSNKASLIFNNRLICTYIQQITSNIHSYIITCDYYASPHLLVSCFPISEKVSFKIFMYNKLVKGLKNNFRYWRVDTLEVCKIIDQKGAKSSCNFELIVIKTYFNKHIFKFNKICNRAVPDVVPSSRVNVLKENWDPFLALNVVV